MIPYRVPPGFFKIVQSTICKYVWNRKRPWIAYNCATKQEGGLAIPDFKRYFLAIALNRLSDWKYHKDSKLWVQLEVDLCGVDLFPLIWIPNRFRRLSPTVSPLTKSSLAMWDSFRKTQKWPYNSLLMQLTEHDYFPPGNMDPRFSNWISTTLLLLHQVATAEGMLPMSELITSTPVSFLDQWKYYQLSQFVKSLHNHYGLIQSWTQLKDCSQGTNLLNNPSLICTRPCCLYLQ